MLTHFRRLIPSTKSSKKMRLNTLFGNQAVGLMLLLWSTVAINGVAQQSLSKVVRQPYSLEVTSKIHTAGHSLYSGIYLNHHANMEMNVTYKNKLIGAFVSKYVDFVDIHSRINYATLGLFKSFRLGESVKLTPYLHNFFSRQWLRREQQQRITLTRMVAGNWCIPYRHRNRINSKKQESSS